MKTIFRLLCGWMAIALAACTGDELQQIEPLQKPVAQKTISVKAYTPSEQAATRLAFTEENDGSLSLAWTDGDAFTADIDNNKVTFTYNPETNEFTANVNESVTLTDGLKAYYPAYDGENFEMDFSQQTGQLNGATTYMEGVYEGDAFSFNHSTAILKASFGLPPNAVISSIQISGAVDITISNATINKDAVYINLPAIAKDTELKFTVTTTDSEVYTATKTVTAVKGIETGVYYNTTVALQEACLLPTGGEFKSAISAVVGYGNATSIVFEANVADETPATRSDSNYTIALAGNVLTISTPLSEFVFNENCSGMFSDLTNIQSIDFGNCVNTAKVTNMSYMFSHCETLTSLNVSSFNTANVTNMASMFSDCQKLTSLDVSSFNTAKVTKMDGMFSYCKKLTSLDLSSFNTANVMTMDDMFNSCKTLTSLDLSSFNTAKVRYMSSMFNGCSALTSLNVSNFNTENVRSMYRMFNECYALTSLDLSNFNTANVTSMANMFNICSSLTSLNVSSFNTANVENMSSMFSYCQKLASLDLSSFDFNGVKNLGGAQNFYQMFYCLGESAAHRPILVYVTLAGYKILNDEKSTTDIADSYAQLVALCELPTGNSFNSAVKSFLSENSSLTKIKFVANSSNTNTSKPISSISGAYMVAGSDNTLEIHTAAAGFLFNKDCNHMFSSLSTITAINFYDCINTANVTDMSYMFNNCSSLTSLDLSSFNTAKVTNMSYMFSHCETLTSLNVSSFNTANVTNMASMFSDCQKLTSLNVSSFNTANVVTMDGMFNSCKTLTSLDLSSFNTSNVMSMVNMFNSCYALTSLDLSSFNTANVIFMYDMFNSCSSLTSLDLSSFNTANVTDMASMFYGCSLLTSLDLSSFNTANVLFMDDMFNGCSALTSLNVSNFNTENVTSMASMFCFCLNISELDLSSFVFKENVILTEMFYYLGFNAKPILVYVKDENDKDKLDNPNTDIPDYAIISVKQP